MALYIKNPEAEALARELARLTGKSMTETVRIALTEKRARLRRKDSPQKMMRDLKRILRGVDGLPVLDTRTEDEILGYDENGVPS